MGRPAKVKNEEEIKQVEEKPKRARGRPSKAKVVVEEEKSEVPVTPKRRGRPAKVVEEKEPSAAAPKRRGRPPKEQVLEDKEVP